MKVREFLAKIDEMKKTGLISDESEVLTFADEFMELCPYEGSDVALALLVNNKFLHDELAEQIDRCQRHLNKIKCHIEDPTFFSEEERDLAKIDLDNKEEDLKKVKALKKKYNTTWKNALVI